MIEIKIASKKFGQKQILKDLTCTVDSGKIIGISGMSGSGKSTLLNIIGQIDTDYEGEIIIDNISTKKMSKRERESLIRNKISYLFQNYALVENDNVKDNLLIALEYDKSTKKVKLNKMESALSQVMLPTSFLKTPVFTLSGGEQQRVALARVFLKTGSLILADEPTGNLDIKNRDIVFKILRSLAEEGKTIVIVSHDPYIISQCDNHISLD